MPSFWELNRLSSMRLMVFAGLVFFVYSLSIGVAIQAYIVPNIFPQFDLGDGLVIPDSKGFNQLAKAKALEIKEQGWGMWELRPKHHTPAGIASIFYAIWTPKPFSLLPLNASVHALSGCLVFWLLRNVFSGRSAAFGSAVFIINPAALEWVAQIHRDGIFIIGNLLVLVCIVQLFRGLQIGNVLTMTCGVLLGVSGTWVVWVARPYWVQVLFVYVLLGIIFISIVFLVTWSEQHRIKYQFSLFILFAVGFLLCQGWVVKYHGYNFASLPKEAVSIQGEITGGKITDGKITDGETSRQTRGQNLESIIQWKRTSWVPETVEEKLFQISLVRMGVSLSGGNTVVDGDVILNSAGSFIGYLPRALQLGLLSPLPELWQGKGSSPAMTLARKVMGIATVAFYGCLLSSLVGVISYRRSPIIWLMLIFSFLGILVFTYTFPNIGTLLRFRYGFYMLLIAFGVANLVELASPWLRKRHQFEPNPSGIT